MKAFGFPFGRSLALLLAGAALASCTAQGQSGRIDPKVHFNETPYSARFYDALLSDRVHVFEDLSRNRNRVQGTIYGADGTALECVFASRSRLGSNSYRQRRQRPVETSWSQHKKRFGSGGYIRWGADPEWNPYTSEFYDPKTGEIVTEITLKNGSYAAINVGQIQDTWPRALADACPDLKIPAHIRINEKQTSRQFDELQQQDPDAPVRNFPGSHLTAPGRTGLGASDGRPTTTKAEVEAFLEAQEGNVLINSKRIALTWVRAGDREELWRIGNHYLADGYWDVVRTEDGEWIEIHDGPKVRRRYPIGYPFPWLPTGHRHPAFQITDAFLAHPRSLEFMGEAYADKRFVFHPEGRFSVVDEAGNLVEGPHFDGVWRWTKGHLEMTVRDDRSYSINWRELAVDVDPPPKMWSRFSRDVGGW